ncbi:MAG: tetratricopeptide repeat protein, partial [Polyangia bacterium]
RQQLWDGALVAQRIAHAGGEVRDPFAGRSARARILHQDQIEQALVTRERSARAVLWEPAGDAPPIAPEKVLPGVPLAQLEDSAAPLPPARPLAERVQALLSPGRDPLVQRMRAAVLCALGRLYLARSDDARAAGLFGAALGELPSDAVAATNLGVVRARHGDYAQAAALVDRVLARDPSRQVARLNSGRYHLELGQLDLAEHQFALARARAPRDPAPLVGLGRVAERRGDRALARSYAALALKLAPGDREAHDFSLEMNR